MGSSNSLAALSQKISESVDILESFLRNNNLPLPSFEADIPRSLLLSDQISSVRLPYRTPLGRPDLYNYKPE
jgi:hypothetical protein